MIFVGLDVAKDKHNCSIKYLRPARGDLFCEATQKSWAGSCLSSRRL